MVLVGKGSLLLVILSMVYMVLLFVLWRAIYVQGRDVPLAADAEGAAVQEVAPLLQLQMPLQLP